MYLLYLPVIEAISFHLHKYLVRWTPHSPFSFSSVIFHLRSFSKDGHKWAYEKDFYILGTFGSEPNPSLVNEQHLQSSSPKYHNWVMLPVGADTPNIKRFPGCHSPCIPLGGPGQKMLFHCHQGVQSKGREAELGHMTIFKGLFPWAVLIGKPGCALSSWGSKQLKEDAGTKQRQQRAVFDGGAHLGPLGESVSLGADISTLQSPKTGSSFG